MTRRTGSGYVYRADLESAFALLFRLGARSQPNVQVYIWGPGSGEAKGDRYEGEFRDGMSHGVGRTIFGLGGTHKVRAAGVALPAIVEYPAAPCPQTASFVYLRVTRDDPWAGALRAGQDERLRGNGVG